MIHLLLAVGTYVAAGYFTFRVWIWRCSPKEGIFGNTWNDPYRNGHTGWYIPGWIDTTEVEPGRPRGQSIEVVFWQSMSMWPLIWLIVFVVKMAREVARFGRAMCGFAIRRSLPPSVLKSTPEDVLLLEEANHEITEFLDENPPNPL